MQKFSSENQYNYLQRIYELRLNIYVNVYTHLNTNNKNLQCTSNHCVKNVRIQSFSGPYFPAFELISERYSVPLCIQSECRKIRTRKTPNTDAFYTVSVLIVYTTTLVLSESIFRDFSKDCAEFPLNLILVLYWFDNGNSIFLCSHLGCYEPTHPIWFKYSKNNFLSI